LTALVAQGALRAADGSIDRLSELARMKRKALGAILAPSREDPGAPVVRGGARSDGSQSMSHLDLLML
jgi:hypothetical protein